MFKTVEYPRLDSTSTSKIAASSSAIGVDEARAVSQEPRFSGSAILKHSSFRRQAPAPTKIRGEPFRGRAGQFCDRYHRAGIASSGSDVYICNVIKMRPPKIEFPNLTKSLRASFSFSTD